MMQRHVSYWLVPAAAERAVFQDLITTLARRYSAPTFVPHVTLYSGESPPDERPLELMAQALHAVHVVPLQVDRILYTAEFTKTLFVQLHPSPVLGQLTEALCRLSAMPSAYVLHPHLSLLYTHMEEAEQRHLAETLALSLSTVICDAVWAIASSGVTRTAADVTQWEVVGCQPLPPVP
jgi:Cyclic phosphodiesterase-like protein